MATWRRMPPSCRPPAGFHRIGQGDDISATASRALPDVETVASRLADGRAADIAEAPNERMSAEAATILQHLPLEIAVAVLDQPSLNCAPEIVTLYQETSPMPLLAGMSADRVADVFFTSPEAKVMAAVRPMPSPPERQSCGSGGAVMLSPPPEHLGGIGTAEPAGTGI
jgi:MgtE intracellular N domain